MCETGNKIIDSFDELVFLDVILDKAPEVLKIACCPDCQLPAIFPDENGAERALVLTAKGLAFLWITSKSHKLT